MPNATIILTECIVWLETTKEIWKSDEKMARCGIFVKKLGSGNVGLQDPPPRSLTDLDYFHTFFSDIYKNEKQKQSSLGSLSLLSNDDGDGNEKGKKSNRFRLAKQQLCTLLHDHNVKVPNFTFCRGRGHKTTTFFSSFPELWYSPLEFNYKNNLPPFNELNEMEWARKRSRQSEFTF